MKRLCLLLALLLALSGCGGETEQTPTQSVSQPVVFDVYAVNDLHGRLSATDTQPGVGGLSTYLRQGENTILLATGDMWQGTAEADLTKGEMATQWMNDLGFAAMTLGGHEYDWGEAQIRENAALAEFPILGINVFSRETGQRVDYCEGSVVVDVQGARIGIIGAIGDCYGSIAARHTEQVFFKTGPELTALVQAEAQRLRSQGVDFIIYAIHDGHDQNTTGVLEVEGLDYYDQTLSQGYVDLVFEADSHYSYVLRDGAGVYHLQAGGNNQGISHARVLVDQSRGDAFVATAEILPQSRYGHLETDPKVAALFEKYAQVIAPATRVLGQNGAYKTGDMLCDLVAQLYRDKGLELWSGYDIVLGGGYLSCRAPGYLQAGQVRYDQLQALFPYDNHITLCSIRGRELLSRFLETDNDAYHVSLTEYGKSIRDSIDPDGVYYLITDSYTSDYAYNQLTVIDTWEEAIFARDLLATHIASTQPEKE